MKYYIGIVYADIVKPDGVDQTLNVHRGANIENGS